VVDLNLWEVSFQFTSFDHRISVEDVPVLDLEQVSLAFAKRLLKIINDSRSEKSISILEGGSASSNLI